MQNESPLLRLSHAMDHLDLASDRLLTFSSMIMVGLLLNHHWLVVTAPVPMDWYEGVMPLITGIIAQGENPYTFVHQPMHANVYPPLYNLIVAPLTGLFENTLVLHRAVSGLCIIAAVILCGLCARRRGSPWSDVLILAALLYAGLLFYSTPVASTNATGMLFFILSVLTPWYRQFDRTGLAYSIGFGLLAFFSKQYFAAGMVMVCGYVFLFLSIRIAIVYGVAVLVVVLCSLWVVHQFSPYYLDNVFFSTTAAASLLRLPSYTLKQLLAYGQVYAGLLSLLAFSLFLLWRRNRLSLPRVNFTNWRKGLLDWELDYFWFCFFIATVLIVVLLGSNPGNWLSYLFQLMSPFLLLAGLATMREARIHRIWVLLLTGTVMVQSWMLLPKDLRPDTANWNKLSMLVEKNERILASPALVSLLTTHDKAVFQNGHTFYFNFAANKPELFKKDDPSHTVAGIWESYNRELYRRVQQQDFEIVLASPWDINGFFGANPPVDSTENGAELFKRYYHKIETLPIVLTDAHGGGRHRIGVWTPRQEPL